jgi:hypothetical protein
MKTIITLLTATVLVAGVTGAMAADRQGSDEATNNNLSWQAARSGSGAYASARIPSGARASVRVPVQAGAGISPGAIGFTADRDPAQFRN